jgi:hypothetical protein
MTAGFREFEFNLPDALLSSLVTAFDVMESGPLALENASQLPEAQGVYQLIYDDQIVYVGKTDGEAGLKQRLTRHASTVRDRCNLDPEQVMFKALRVFVFTAVDLETQLIRHYGGLSKVSWNKSGFGSNDPGRERDTTKIKPGGFDERFPIDLDREIRIVEDPTGMTVARALDLLNTLVSYRVRAASTKGRPHSDLSASVLLPGGIATARQVLLNLLAALQPGWQATLLPGRVILYPENREYSAGVVIGRS